MKGRASSLGSAPVADGDSPKVAALHRCPCLFIGDVSGAHHKAVAELDVPHAAKNIAEAPGAMAVQQRHAIGGNLPMRLIGRKPFDPIGPAHIGECGQHHFHRPRLRIKR